MFFSKIHQLKLWQKKPFLIYSAVFLLVLLFFIVQILRPNREILYNDSYRFISGTPSDYTTVYEGISLAPGVYLVELTFESDTDLNGHCNVEDGTVFTGGLLCNGEHLYSKQNSTNFHMWLFEQTEQLQIQVSYNGNGNLTIGDLHLKDTGLLWTMLLTIFLFAGILGFLLLIYFYYNQAYPVSRTCKETFFWIALITLFASVPYLSGYTISGGDLTYHLMRIEGIKDSLLNGIFPARLEPEWLYNHGYANGIFYCNLLLYFPALLRLLGFPVSISYNAYCIVINIATAWISYYCFSRIFKHRNIGLICSALYTFSIIRIYKFLVTSAVGEASAFVFLPLVFYGLYRILSEDTSDKSYRNAWVPLMLGYAGLMQTHILSCEITAFVTLLFCIACIKQIFTDRRVFLAFLKAAVGSVLLSLWFLVPFLDYYLTQDVHVKHVAARTIQSAGLQVAHLLFHFWRSGAHTASNGYGVYDSHPSGLGLFPVAALAVFLILWLNGILRSRKGKELYFIKLTAIVGLLLSILSLSLFPWDKLQATHPIAASLISSLQFPNRFLGWATLCLIAVAGYIMHYLQEHPSQFYRYFTFLAAFSIATSGIILLDSANSGHNFYKIYNEEGMGFGYISGAEYLIEGTEQSRLTFAEPLTGEGVALHSFTSGPLSASFRCTNTTPKESFLDLPLLYYKGYVIRPLAGTPSLTDTPFPRLAYGENNVIRVLLPAGFDGELLVRFESPLYWRISELISLGTVLLLTISAVLKRKGN